MKPETPEYNSWRGMVQRCTNPKHMHYHLYGGRGITICDRWRLFTNFLQDMGDKPSPRLSIERVDNEKGYSPSNCMWATNNAQTRNSRIQRNNTTGVRGVTFRKATGKYEARIGIGTGRRKYIGRFSNIQDAAYARRVAEKEQWGRYAPTTKTQDPPR